MKGWVILVKNFINKVKLDHIIVLSFIDLKCEIFLFIYLLTFGFNMYSIFISEFMGWWFQAF